MEPKNVRLTEQSESRKCRFNISFSSCGFHQRLRWLFQVTFLSFALMMRSGNDAGEALE